MNNEPEYPDEFQPSKNRDDIKLRSRFDDFLAGLSAVLFCPSAVTPKCYIHTPEMFFSGRKRCKMRNITAISANLRPPRTRKKLKV